MAALVPVASRWRSLKDFAANDASVMETTLSELEVAMKANRRKLTEATKAFKDVPVEGRAKVVDKPPPHCCYHCCYHYHCCYCCCCCCHAERFAGGWTYP